MTENMNMKDSIFRIGKVFSVEGRAIRVSVDKEKNSSHLLYKGDLIKNVSVGSYIKIIKGFTKIIGKVEGEYTFEDKVFSSKDYRSEPQKINRTLGVILLGFFKKNNRFERGIKEMPLIDNECYLLDKEEFYNVHDFISKDDKELLIGKLTLEKGQEIKVGINSLFASHIGIFGNTGSGKSYTLAKIYTELFKKYKESPNFQLNAKFFLLDFNGEYVDESNNIIVNKEFKNIYILSTKKEIDKYPISKDTLYETSFWTVLLEATEKTQTPFLRRALSNEWLSSNISDADSLISLIKSTLLLALRKNDKQLGAKVLIEFLSEMDSSFPISNISDIRDFLSKHLQYYNKNNEFVFIEDSGSWKFGEDVHRLVSEKLNEIKIVDFSTNDLDKLKLQIIFQYYDDIIKGFANQEHLSPLIKRIHKRFEDIRKVIVVNDDLKESKNFTIVSLRDVNIYMRKILPLLLCKQLYDEQKKESNQHSYLNIIIDEAHNILSRDSERESEQWKDYRLETFEEIIKEGRKFGVFLTLASQRPSDISPTIISQLHNFFLHRLINNNDILAIERTISYLDKLSFDTLPILPTGTCILAGLTAQVPVIIDISKIEDEHEPNNKTIGLVENWS